jgi:hypothetical protein
MELRTGLRVVVAAALLAAACSSPPDNQIVPKETTVPTVIEETAIPSPTVETLSATLGALAQTLRDAVLTAPPD